MYNVATANTGKINNVLSFSTRTLVHYYGGHSMATT